VVNAGVFIAAPLTEYTEDMFDQTATSTLKALSQRSIEHCLFKRWRFHYPDLFYRQRQRMATASAYAATKAAVRSLARGFSSELLTDGSGSMYWLPAPRYPDLRKNGSHRTDRGDEDYLSNLTLKRLGTSEEMPKAFSYLASDDSKYMVEGSCCSMRLEDPVKRKTTI